ncbi:MAG: hypothetical protein AAGA65_10620 [Actinomycetota bacterium]
MFRRLLVWAVRSYIGGPARSWVFTSAALLAVRLVRSVTGRRELIDLSSVKPGDTLTIEHLPISHRRQIRDIRRSKRQERKAARQTAKA